MNDPLLCVLCPYVTPTLEENLALPSHENTVFEPGLAIFARYFNIDVPPPQLCKDCIIRVNEYKCACGKVVGHTPDDPVHNDVEILPPLRECFCGQTICDDCTIRSQTGEDFAILSEWTDDLIIGDPVCAGCMHSGLALSAARFHYANIRNAYFGMTLGCSSNIVHTLWTLAWPASVAKDRTGKKGDETASYFSVTLNRHFDPPVNWNPL